MASIGAVLEALGEAGFRHLKMPFMIGGTRFEFGAVMVATGASQDLVVVEPEDADRQRTAELLGGMNRALDMLESRRSVTLVLLGDPPPRDTLRQLQDSARLLMVRDPGSAQEIEDSLAVLLPLRLPETGTSPAPPIEGLRARLQIDDSNDVEPILAAAQRGVEAVREAMRVYIEDPLEAAREGDSR